MNEQDCQFLISLAKTKNITRTAQQHFVTQSALTKLIQRLEKELGCQLLLRSQKGVIFTPEGERVVCYCEQNLKLKANLQLELNAARDIVSGSLAFGCSINYCRYSLPAVLKTYLTNYPQVELQVKTGHSRLLYNELLADKLSLAILRGDFKWEEGRQRLSTEPFYLVHAQSLKPEKLAATMYIGHTTDTNELYNVNRWAAENNLDLHTSSLWLDDISSCLEMVQAGVGWSILPGICLEHYKGSKAPLFFQDGTPLSRNTYVLYRNAQKKLPQVRAFLALLQQPKK